jgi:hypothetical protein
MMRRPHIWRFRHYLLTGTPRNLGNRARLLLTLTDNRTADVVWSAHLFSPFDELILGFDDVVSKLAQASETDADGPDDNPFVGAAAREQAERTQAARELARIAHNRTMSRLLNR